MDLSDVDLVCLDCDGVLWLGETPIEGALETLQTLKAAEKQLTFVCAALLPHIALSLV